jgi:hypothetical protein
MDHICIVFLLYDWKNFGTAMGDGKVQPVLYVWSDWNSRSIAADGNHWNAYIFELVFIFGFCSSVSGFSSFVVSDNSR